MSVLKTRQPDGSWAEIPAIKGNVGAAPEIGPNGNWWINGIDTGKPATVGSGGVSSWGAIQNKPFERLGESLKVADGTLDINVYEVSNEQGGNTLVIGF